MMVPKDYIYPEAKRMMDIAGVSTEELAEATGLTTQTWCNKLAGRRKMTLEDLYRWGEAVGIPDSELLRFFPKQHTVRRKNFRRR